MLRGWINAIQRNHGLEHATVTVLFERYGAQRIAGRAGENGFFIIGDVDLEVLDECAREALNRIQQGQRELVVSPLCGTNILITGFLTAAVVLGTEHRTKRQSRGDTFINAATFAMLATIASQPIGSWLQRFVTTSSDIDRLEIVDTRQLFPGLKKVFTRETSVSKS